jgi:uncharacterized cupredoxin-like copper-binding protein
VRLPHLGLPETIVGLLFVAVVGLAFGQLALDPLRSGPLHIEIRIHYSQFEPAILSVPRGRPVTFVLRNDDPIDHEWLIGDEQMHQRHRSGTEPYHASRPTEVSIPALSTVETTITFTAPVSWRYICHLPGHEAYGMVGLLTTR